MPITRIATLRFLETSCACGVTLASKVTLLACNRVMGGVSWQYYDKVIDKVPVKVFIVIDCAYENRIKSNQNFYADGVVPRSGVVL